MFFDKVLLSTAYFAPIEYFAAIANADNLLIEGCEIYQKQSYRTRCSINGSNGVLVLTVPVLRGAELSHKQPIKDIAIDYSKPWVMQHKRAIEASYRNSPFFEYYVDDIFPILDREIESLFTLNMNLTLKMLELIGIDKSLNITTDYSKEFKGLDLREAIHPKRESTLLTDLKLEKPYYQVFTNKQGFISNLSILDLLFNEGPNTISFLEAV